jgi:hypothetical protein
MAQISTTGQLESAAREMMTRARYTMEHNAPVYGLVQHYKLAKGHDTANFPKFGQMTISALSEGIDMVDEEDLGMTNVSVTTGEFGAKIIMTDKLLRENTAVTWAVPGRQMGDAYTRLRETELINLFTSLNGGTRYGAANTDFSAANVIACISVAKADKVGTALNIIHHPNCISTLAKDLTTIGTTNMRPLPEGYSSRLMNNYWTGIRINGSHVFETGNIERDSGDDATGAIMDEMALAVLEEKTFGQERERDASLRAWELNVVTDFAAFELDDSLGVGLFYKADDPSTSQS